jgi:hypothetical protein
VNLSRAARKVVAAAAEARWGGRKHILFPQPQPRTESLLRVHVHAKSTDKSWGGWVYVGTVYCRVHGGEITALRCGPSGEWRVL